MNTELTHKKIQYGLFLGLAISSRFLLSFNTQETWTHVLDFILLFGMYSALIMWVKEYQKTLPDKKISFKQVLSFSVQIFLVGAVVSSIFKYIYFEFIKPQEFAIIVNEIIEDSNTSLKHAHEQYVLSLKGNDGLSVFKQAYFQSNINSITWHKTVATSIYFEPIISILRNVLGGLVLGWFIWPLFKFKLQKPTTNQ